jgi:hypothetical protein
MVIASSAPAAARRVFPRPQRIEQMLFDGAPKPASGQLTPDPASPGLGLRLRAADAERFRRL